MARCGGCVGCVGCMSVWWWVCAEWCAESVLAAFATCAGGEVDNVTGWVFFTRLRGGGGSGTEQVTQRRGRSAPPTQAWGKRVQRSLEFPGCTGLPLGRTDLLGAPVCAASWLSALSVVRSGLSMSIGALVFGCIDRSSRVSAGEASGGRARARGAGGDSRLVLVRIAWCARPAMCLVSPDGAGQQQHTRVV